MPCCVTRVYNVFRVCVMLVCNLLCVLCVCYVCVEVTFAVFNKDETWLVNYWTWYNRYVTFLMMLLAYTIQLGIKAILCVSWRVWRVLCCICHIRFNCVNQPPLIAHCTKCDLCCKRIVLLSLLLCWHFADIYCHKLGYCVSVFICILRCALIKQFCLSQYKVIQYCLLKKSIHCFNMLSATFLLSVHLN